MTCGSMQQEHPVQLGKSVLVGKTLVSVAAMCIVLCQRAEFNPKKLG